MSSYHILWIDDDRDFLQAMRTHFDAKYRILCAHNLTDGMAILNAEQVDLALIDLEIGEENGLEGLQLIRQQCPSLPVVMISGRRESAHIVRAIRAGAADYLCKPFDPDELAALVEKMCALNQLRSRHDALVADLNPPSASRPFLGESPKFRALLRQTARLKGHQAHVLIRGESGTGKELLARHIHQLESDTQRPFIAVNCAAIPEGLMESELFGHEKGAFTGASQRKPGKFELANGGDIFLDEIGTLRLELQAKILRVLQEQEVVRVGGAYPIKVSFRVLSATNESLDTMVAQGRFRMDLFHRLRVIQLDIPSLTERPEDIPLLVAHFLEKYRQQGAPKQVTPAALELLQAYAWPGNIRELENVIHSLIILTPGEQIDASALPVWLLGHPVGALHATTTPSAGAASDAASAATLRDYVRQVERQYISHVMRCCDGDKSATAQSLGIGRTTLYSKLRELDMLQ